MEEITSTKNPTFKRLLRLATNRRARREAGLSVFDGVKIVDDYLDSGRLPEMIIFDESRLGEPVIANLLRKSTGARQVVLKSFLLAKLSQVETSPGVIGVIKTPKLDWRDFNPSEKPILLLEKIQDPGNLGTILRSALAFGVGAALLSEDSVEVFSPKVVRASMGACFNLPVYENVNLGQFIKQIKNDYKILATSSHAEMAITKVDLRESVAWLFGNEGGGLTADMEKLADQSVLIPQSSAIESLNLSMAVTVCLYEQARQLVKS